VFGHCAEVFYHVPQRVSASAKENLFMWELPNDQELPPAFNPVITNDPFSLESFLLLLDEFGCFSEILLKSFMTGLLY
jgi:hypothetical protein